MRAARRGQAQLLQELHAAIREELDAVGYLAVTFEGVARRAATSKPVLYRRYRSRAQMVLEALASQVGTLSEDDLPGTLRADLVSTLRAARDRFEIIGRATYRGLLAEGDDEVFTGVLALTGSIAEILVHTVVQPAQARGELGPRPVPLAASGAPVALLRDALMLGPVSDRDIDTLVDDVVVPLLRATAGL